MLGAAAGLAGLVVLAGAVLGGEAYVAARRTYVPAESAPQPSGTAGRGGGSDPVRLAVLGDSTAAGLGARRSEETVGGALAARLADRTRRQVAWTSYGVSGARTDGLSGQVDRTLTGPRPDLAVVLIGANDATGRTSLDDVRRDLGAAVARLREAGLPVVVGTCPDMGAARALLPPLRQVVAARGRAVAAAEAEAVRAAGGVPVDLGRLTGPAFRADPATLSEDLFHPSARGYALWADALAPAAADALRTE